MSVLRRYVLSFGAGLLAGGLYWLLGVNTPAPPWSALLGLLGIVVGEVVGGALLRRMPSRRRSPHDPRPVRAD